MENTVFEAMLFASIEAVLVCFACAVLISIFERYEP